MAECKMEFRNKFKMRKIKQCGRDNGRSACKCNTGATYYSILFIVMKTTNMTHPDGRISPIMAER